MMEVSGRTKNDEQRHCFSVSDRKGLGFFVTSAERHVIIVCRGVFLGQEGELYLVVFACIRGSSRVSCHGRGTRGNVDAIQRGCNRFLAVTVHVCLVFHVKIGPVA